MADQKEQKTEAKKAEQKGKSAEVKGKPQYQQSQKKQIHIVRVAETDLDGAKKVADGIREIRGVSFMFANALAYVSPLAENKILDLSEDEIKQLEDLIFNPQKHGVPSWMYNRRLDPETGVNKHLTVSHLHLAQTTDINKMKKMKCYKGVRHSLGLPVRGQRTRSSFRGKGTTVGVSKVKEKPAKAGGSPPSKK